MTTSSRASGAALHAIVRQCYSLVTTFLATPGCVLLALLASCSPGGDVTLYVALDQEHSERLVHMFEARSGLAVRTRYDTEASKTVGLVNAIVEERGRPRCDVFWNNELAQTVRLGQLGLLQPYRSPAASDIPAAYRDASGRYTGFAARARILIVNTERIPDPAAYPRSMWALVDPRWKGQCAIARPLTGTTLTHFAALHQVLGEQEFARFEDGLAANEVVLLQSNGATMRQVAEGRLAFAFTDTDDFNVARTKGYPVQAVFPDQGENEIGTMLIPNSVGIVAGAPHPDAARRLVDFILSPQVEGLLAASKSAQIPLRSSVEVPANVKRPGAFKVMAWDPEKVAASLATLSRRFATRYGR